MTRRARGSARSRVKQRVIGEPDRGETLKLRIARASLASRRCNLPTDNGAHSQLKAAVFQTRNWLALARNRKRPAVGLDAPARCLEDHAANEAAVWCHVRGGRHGLCRSVRTLGLWGAPRAGRKPATAKVRRHHQRRNADKVSAKGVDIEREIAQDTWPSVRLNATTDVRIRPSP